MRGSAVVTTPSLVYVSADVQVIEDYHEPVFYSSNMYWRFDGGVWYSSRYHTRDWVRVTVLPPQIQRIEQPTMYIRYKGDASAKAAAKAEHREDKAEAKEDRQEAKEERQEAKAEAKEERKEAKEDRKEAKEDRKEAKDDHKGKHKK